ncbi:MAG: hypothetical protein HXY30_10070 [Pseudorhodoplanes sp.]|nr:hypothetical protein [Pseudorhodoplanes sp.]
MSDDSLTRFLGGTPLAVLARLVLLSILIGVLLAAFGLDPYNIIDSVRRLIIRIWEMGFDAIEWLWRYFLLGAVIVIPIWFVVRLVNAPKGR